MQLQLLLSLFLLLLVATNAHHVSCVLYENSTLWNSDYLSQISNTTSQNLTFIGVSDTLEIQNYMPCTAEMLLNHTDVYMVPTDMNTIANLNISHPLYDIWLQFAQTYRPWCSETMNNAPTATLWYACQAYRTLQPFHASVDQLLYPRSAELRGRNISLADIPFLSSFLNRTFETPISTKWSDLITWNSTFMRHTVQAWEHSTFRHMLPNIPKALSYAVRKTKANFKGFYKRSIKPIVNHFHRFLKDEIHDHMRNFAREMGENGHYWHGEVEDILEHTSNVQFRYHENGTLLHHIVSFAQDVTHQDYRKSRVFHLKHTHKWNNMADSQRNFSIVNVVHMYHGVATVSTWLFHLDGYYNETGCLGRGFPWLPKVTAYCKYPILVAPTEVRLYPSGFDPLHPGCFWYFSPLVSIPAMCYVTSYYTGLDTWLDNNEGYKRIPPFNLVVYNATSNNHTLPANMIPCSLYNPLGFWVLGFTVFWGFFCLGVLARLWASIKKAIWKNADESYLQRLPDLRELIPPPEQTMSVINSGISGAVTELNGLSSKVPQITKGVTGALSKLNLLVK